MKSTLRLFIALLAVATFSACGGGSMNNTNPEAIKVVEMMKGPWIQLEVRTPDEMGAAGDLASGLGSALMSAFKVQFVFEEDGKVKSGAMGLVAENGTWSVDDATQVVSLTLTGEGGQTTTKYKASKEGNLLVLTPVEANEATLVYCREADFEAEFKKMNERNATNLQEGLDTLGQMMQGAVDSANNAMQNAHEGHTGH